MTMDALELLGRLGQVEPADQAVLDAALRRLDDAARQDLRPAGPGPRAARRTRMLTAVAAGTVVLAAVAVAVAAGRPGVASRAGGSGVTRSRARPGVAPVPAPSPGTPTIAAVLTAFSASGSDILMVTKTMRGDFGPLGKTVIWISPAVAAPGAAVTSRILSFTLAGASLSDKELTYAAPRAAPATSDCGAVFGRPRVALTPASGVPGTMTFVNYPERLWGKASVAVQPATVPSAAGLRACLAAGQWHIAGHGSLGGARVIELASPPGYWRLWVSAATLLPVRLVSSGPDADTITFMFRFLAPTAANRATLAAPVPAGFRRTSG
jgi:hypothetical protein